MLATYSCWRFNVRHDEEEADLAGFEPATVALTGRCSAVELQVIACYLL
jgi:hypothetical protein